jgi:hypothetical protein
MLCMVEARTTLSSSILKLYTNLLVHNILEAQSKVPFGSTKVTLGALHTMVVG